MLDPSHVFSMKFREKVTNAGMKLNAEMNKFSKRDDVQYPDNIDIDRMRQVRYDDWGAIVCGYALHLNKPEQTSYKSHQCWQNENNCLRTCWIYFMEWRNVYVYEMNI